MKLATFIAPGRREPWPGEVRGDEVITFSDGVHVGVRVALGRREPADGDAFPLDEVTFQAPLPPGAIYAIGLNYSKHAKEVGAEPPEVPIVFAKAPSSSTAPGGPVRCPEVVRRLDYEVELAVVMGPGGEIAGYAVADDVSGRDLQGREPHWVRGKGAETFCPWGPWITTADEVPDPGDLELRCWVNDELRQDSSTSDLIFGVDELVAFLAQTQRLDPGDLILTGTPGGVGMAMDPPRFLQSGDVVRMEIESLGSIEHAIA